jgi:hypothetical protein
LKRALKEPRLEKPTRKQTSVTVKFALRRSSPGEVVERRLAIGGAERANEVKARVACLSRDGVQVERLRVGAIHEVLGLPQMYKTIDIRHERAHMARRLHRTT